MSKIFPNKCPACNHALHVKVLACEACQTEISGQFLLPSILALNPDEQQFLIEFVVHSGSLKEMAKLKGLSYPTVRNLLDQLILKLQTT